MADPATLPPAERRLFTVRDGDAVAEIVLAARAAVPPGEAMLVAVSGIDGSGSSSPKRRSKKSSITPLSLLRRL